MPDDRTRVQAELIGEDFETDDVRTYLDGLGFDPDTDDPIASDLAGRGELSREAARELRLDQAHRLEADLDRQISAAGD